MRKIILGLSILTTVACSSQNTFQVVLDYPPAYSDVKKNYKEGELVRIIYAEGGGFKCTGSFAIFYFTEIV